jgi:branched-chain amino acid transport system substrate-binding protein
MGKRMIPVLIATVFIVSGLISCKQDEPIKSYKIGALVSQTGNYAGLGRQALEGMQFSVSEINDAGGINGIPLELVVYDDKSEVTEVALTAKKAVEIDNVIALLEGTVTQLASSLIPIANELKVPAAGISGTALFDDQLGAWFFRPMGGESGYAYLILDYMNQDLGITEYAALLENSGYGQGGKVFLPILNPNHNLTIVEEQYFDPGATDLTPQLNKIANSNAKAILIWGSSPTASMAIKQAREMGITLPILTTPTQASPNMVASFGQYYEMEPTVASCTSKMDIWEQLPDSDPDRELLGEFAVKWETKYDGVPTMWNILGSQLIVFIADGLNRSQPNPDNFEQARSELRIALENTEDLVLLHADYTMSPDDHYGCTRQKLIMVTYKNGKLIYIP